MGKRIIPRHSDGRFSRFPTVDCQICKTCGAINLPEHKEIKGFIAKEYPTHCHSCKVDLASEGQRS